LLDDPLRRRMSGYVAVQNLPPAVLNHEKAVQQLERQCRHGEEVEGHDHLAVILEKRKPALARIATAPDSSQIPSHAPFADDEAEFLQFPVDSGGSPVQVFFRQPPDQATDFIGDLGPAAARPGTPTPVALETSAVPADDGVGLHDHEDVAPAGPEAT
jgi:hypothetical protein